jgi:molybdopterin synthase sulfur carrier subunit
MSDSTIPDSTISDSTITVTVKLFAVYQEICGVPEMALEFPIATPVAAVRDRLIAQYPQLEKWSSVTRFGINLDEVEPDTPMQNGDEVVLIPPVSGGM